MLYLITTRQRSDFMIKPKYVDPSKLYTRSEATEAMGISKASFSKYFAFDKPEELSIKSSDKRVAYSGLALNKRIDKLTGLSQTEKLKRDLKLQQQAKSLPNNNLGLTNIVDINQRVSDPRSKMLTDQIINQHSHAKSETIKIQLISGYNCPKAGLRYRISKLAVKQYQLRNLTINQVIDALNITHGEYPVNINKLQEIMDFIDVPGYHPVMLYLKQGFAEYLDNGTLCLLMEPDLYQNIFNNLEYFENRNAKLIKNYLQIIDPNYRIVYLTTLKHKLGVYTQYWQNIQVLKAKLNEARYLQSDDEYDIMQEYGNQDCQPVQSPETDLNFITNLLESELNKCQK